MVAEQCFRCIIEPIWLGGQAYMYSGVLAQETTFCVHAPLRHELPRLNRTGAAAPADSSRRERRPWKVGHILMKVVASFMFYETFASFMFMNLSQASLFMELAQAAFFFVYL